MLNVFGDHNETEAAALLFTLVLHSESRNQIYGVSVNHANRSCLLDVSETLVDFD